MNNPAIKTGSKAARILNGVFTTSPRKCRVWREVFSRGDNGIAIIEMGIHLGCRWDFAYSL
jgi:hypothetical protein